jgi:thioredoxin-like negative regulator of GroEL
MTDTQNVTAEELAMQVQRLSKLLTSTVARLEETERMASLTLFIQDELCGDVARLFNYAAEQRQQTRAAVMAADVFANSTAHEEYRSS